MLSVVKAHKTVCGRHKSVCPVLSEKAAYYFSGSHDFMVKGCHDMTTQAGDAIKHPHCCMPLRHSVY